jgi:hypothetical protein
LLTQLFILELAHHPEYLLAHGFAVLDPICQTHTDAAAKVIFTPGNLVQPAAASTAAWADKPEAPPSRRHYGAGEFNGNREL